MTLIIGLGDQTRSFLISDRRLTANGSVVDDESNKAAVLVCQDARAVLAFTGLAEAGTFRTRFWLLGALSGCASPNGAPISPLLEAFRERATQDFKKLNVSGDKRLAVLFAGYTYSTQGEAKPFWASVHNFGMNGEASPEFHLPRSPVPG